MLKDSRLDRQAFCYKFPKNKFIKIAFMGDAHSQSRFHATKLFKAHCKDIKNKKYYLITMGDMINAAIFNDKASKSDDTMTIEEAEKYVYLNLKPLSKQILGVLSGNHEYKEEQKSGRNASRNLAGFLDVDYYGFKSFIELRVGKQTYKLLVIHRPRFGGSAVREIEETLLKNLDFYLKKFDIDFVAFAHIHTAGFRSKNKITTHGKKLKYTQKAIVSSGHYLFYDNSYADDFGYDESPKGYVAVKFHGNKKKIEYVKD